MLQGGQLLFVSFPFLLKGASMYCLGRCILAETSGMIMAERQDERIKSRGSIPLSIDSLRRVHLRPGRLQQPRTHPAAQD